MRRSLISSSATEPGCLVPTDEVAVDLLDCLACDGLTDAEKSYLLVSLLRGALVAGSILTGSPTHELEAAFKLSDRTYLI